MQKSVFSLIFSSELLETSDYYCLLMKTLCLFALTPTPKPPRPKARERILFTVYLVIKIS